ncbi:MerR family transcriptional regulator [Arthrobacter sp. MYb224]|uniref:MerR family transcriptional regulator n=1 Tax=Micrococcaceae TaxID=1268 RepID=UPI000CFAEA99|nr:MULTISPECIES: MerR family transcriptional regulator [unclassified Arthrobacter]PQZ98824.1 MerR family transcriptional regulator [Arthrobacter sp. MYb224]PRA03160.1 MerR family transcriptional regulator [Arthrobacter sp. MYb229]PRB49631.1 MerR family transcriptional regulator [Arthrobacter sp. MYb216]
MLSIGAFAQIGQVTHRMLRHWDTAGLLVPADVDEFSGYRSYDPAQLERLHRIVALRQLGFGLEDISLILDQGVDVDRIAALLRVRQAEVEAEHRLATSRLRDVARRLDLITKEKLMSHIEIIHKPLPAVRLAAGRFSVSEQPEIAGSLGPLFDQVAGALRGASLTTPIAQYTGTENGVDVIAGYLSDAPPSDEFEIIELEEVPEAICGIHLGPMDRIHESWQAVHGEVLARGLVPAGPCRELYVRAESEDQTDWVTELQQPVTDANR